MAYKFMRGEARLSGSMIMEGAITAESSALSGSELNIGNNANLSEADLEKIDDITNGTAAAAKALVLGANLNIGTLNSLTSSTLTANTAIDIGGQVIDSTEAGYINGVSAGTAAASKAVVLGANKNISILNSLTSSTLTADTAIHIGGTVIDATDAGKLDGITNGTAAANKAMVLGANKNIGVVTSLTSSTITTNNSLEVTGADGRVIADFDSGDGRLRMIEDDDSVGIVIRSSGTISGSSDLSAGGNLAVHGNGTVAGNFTVDGNLTISGTTTTVSTTNLLVEDKLITLNDGGASSTAGGAGIEFEEGGSVTGFIKVASNRTEFELQAPGNSNTLTIDMDAAGEIEFSAAKKLTVGGNFNIDADISSTAAEINLLDHGTSIGSSITIADADGILIHNADGAMEKVPVTDLKDYVAGASTAVSGTVALQGADRTIDNNFSITDSGVTLVDTSANPVLLTLPSASQNMGEIFIIKDLAGTAGTDNITLVLGSGSTETGFDGDSEIKLESNFAAINLMAVSSSNGHGYMIF